MNILDLSAQQLRRAAAIKERVERLQRKLATILGGPATPQAAAAAPKKKGKLSAAGRAAIRAAQKARWAKVKAAAKPAPPKKKKFTMSAAAKAAISKAAKARWAKKKAAAGK